jgi:CRP-like cAMP-binding protein
MQSHPFERLITAPMQSKDVGISKGQDKTTIIDNQNDILKDKAKIQNDNKGHITNNKQQQEISIRNKDISEAKVTRKEEVLRIIQVRKSSTIADISSYIKDCSVKTIQRILGELAEEGRIERRGNKRWTTYHII